MNLPLFAIGLRKLFSRQGLAPERSKTTRAQDQGAEDHAVPTVIFNPAFGPETYEVTSQNSNFTVLNNPKVDFIFWGEYWGTPAGANQVSTLSRDALTLLDSPYLDG